ncbi:hypothetical protein ACOJUR_09900 [Alicyclobacillus tolerans]|uniref:Transposase n=2 Tax=Alicyclobacillus tolerans TaxID=90970 RepID=A0ABT9LWL2_9BACL|nr:MULTISPECIES: hypothetical protein [Alicyclobacillus]MDP9728660.1 hypothetical protein [Alicyclobacillus tengchongensis]SHK42697.1 hypothetical protein SAMN05443507_113106 [Alicyclobacillus montanus]
MSWLYYSKLFQSQSVAHYFALQMQNESLHHQQRKVEVRKTRSGKYAVRAKIYNEIS